MIRIHRHRNPSPAPAPAPSPPGTHGTSGALSAQAAHIAGAGSTPAPAPAPAVATTFKIAANIGGIVDFAPELQVTDMLMPFKGFGTTTDVYRSTLARPALDPITRFPAEDFSVVLSNPNLSGSAQVIKCKLLGIATITVAAPGFTLANVVVSGDDTTFDINVIAGVQGQAVMTFKNTKKTAASATNTGCRGLIIKAPGFAVTDTTFLMPYMAARFAPFSRLRWMTVSATNNNVYCVTPGDRAKDGIMPNVPGLNTIRTVSLENAIRACNETGKNLWWNIYVGANDALITDIATTVRDRLDPALNVIFEYGNENWNYATAFTQSHNYCMDIAMEAVNGFSFQYSCHNLPSTWSLTSNVVTVTMTLPHNWVAGMEAYVGNLSDASVVPAVAVGVKGPRMILSCPTPYTLTYAEPHATNCPVQKCPSTYVFRVGRVLVSAVRTAGQMLVRTGIDHGGVVGQIVGPSFTGSGNSTPITSVPSPRELTFASAGADGPYAMGGGTSLVMTFTNVLNSFDHEWSQFIIKDRSEVTRAVQMSQICQSVFGPGTFGDRLRIAWLGAPGGNPEDPLTYVRDILGIVPNTVISHIGRASYPYYDASKFGGPNLRDVSTYNGNTPPSIADYANAMLIAGQNCGDTLLYRYDRDAFCVGVFGVRMVQYEFGPNAGATSATIDGAIKATCGLQKIDTLFDPLYKPAYRALLDGLENGGYEEVCCYHAGSAPVGTNDVLACWGIYRDYTSAPVTVRAQAIIEKMAAPRTGPNRNLLAISGTTNIDGHYILSVYSNAGPYPNMGAAQSFVITAPAPSNWSFAPSFTCTHATACVLEVNGQVIGAEYPIPVGASTPAVRTITLKQGCNGIRLRQGSLSIGTVAQVTNLAFTRI